MKSNIEIRIAIKSSCLFTWQIAQKLGVHENTFYRWMRTEMSREREDNVINAIEEIKKEMEKEGVM